MQCAVIWPGGRGGGELIIIQSRRFEHLTRLKVMGNKIRSWRKRGRKKEHASSSRPPFSSHSHLRFPKKKNLTGAISVTHYTRARGFSQYWMQLLWQ